MRILLILAAAAALAACATPLPPPPVMPNGGPASPGWSAGIPLTRFDGAIPHHYQYSSALRNPLNLTIRSQSEWDGIWRRLTANQGPPTLPPGVNFERDMLLISAMGARPTGGYATRIERVIEHPFSLEAHVVRTSPGPRCGAIAAVTHPVDIVTVPTSRKQVRWVMHAAVTNCP